MSEQTPRAWSNSDLLRAFAIFFLVFLFLQALWISRTIVLVAILGILFGLALKKAVDVLERWHIKRGIGAALVTLLTLGALIGLGALLAPKLREQGQQLQQKLPEALDKIEQRTGASPEMIADALQIPTGVATGGDQKKQEQKPDASSQPQQQAQQPQGQKPQAAAGGQGIGEEKKKEEGSKSEQQQQTPRLRSRVSSQLGKLSQFLFPFVSGTIAAIGGLIFIIFMAMYVAAEASLYRRGIIHLIPPARRDRATEVLDELGDLLRRWLVARLIAMVVVGVITGGALALMKVPAASALGVISGLLEFIPFIGPIVSSIPAIGMALVVSPTKAIYVVILFIIIQQLEGNVITPLLLKNRLDVPPAVTIFAVSAMGVIFGVLGMLVAEPLVAAALLLTKRLYVDPLEGNTETADS